MSAAARSPRDAEDLVNRPYLIQIQLWMFAFG